jgi:hypothetical protein
MVVSSPYLNNKAGRMVLVLLSAALLHALPVLAQSQLRPSDVHRENSPVDGVFRDDSLYTLTLGGERAVLGFRSEDRRLRFEISKEGNAAASAELPATRKMEFLLPLLTRFFEEYGKDPRYTFVMNFYTEMTTRIADMAVDSKEWDRRTGAAAKAGNDFVLKKLKASSAPYRELAATVRVLGYRINVESIENRIVLPFKEFSRYEKSMMTTHPSPSDKLPGGVSVYFVLEKEH